MAEVNMQPVATDARTIVVGAGFAGLVAARELVWAGHSVLIVEARERIGGRTFTDQRLGRELELGGTWVHWMQPFVWAEITRYRQEVVASPTPRDAFWITEGRIESAPFAALAPLVLRAQEALQAGARELFPKPFDLLAGVSASNFATELQGAWAETDASSLLDVLRDGTFTQEEIDLTDAYWSGGYNGSTATASPMMVKRWVALADFSQRLLDDCTLLYRLRDGMKSLYDAIAEELPPGSIQLGAAVSSIEHRERSVLLTLEDGRTLAADHVVVTAPITALRNIRFDPPLPAIGQKLVDEGLNSTGCKIWIKVRGRHPLIAMAPAGYPLNLVRAEYFTDDGCTLLVGFGADHQKLSMDDPRSAQRALATWFPDLEVVDSTGFDWVADRWSQQTWATYRRGQLSGGWQSFLHTGTRLRFAGADYATGWNSFVDGAIQSGLQAAREIIASTKPPISAHASRGAVSP